MKNNTILTGIMLVACVVTFINMRPAMELSKNDIVINVQIDTTSLTTAWHAFFNKNSWTDLIAGYAPINGGCGLVYEVPNFLDRPNESVAIVDMRQVVVAEPHYHPHTEVYFVLHGEALVVIGNEKRDVKAGDTVVIPPYKAHYTLPNDQFIIAAVNTPPFRPEHYITLSQSDSSVDFDYDEYKKDFNG